MPTNRKALEGLGEDILNVMYEAPDAVWADWLKAPFQEAAGWGDIRLTTALKKAGAKGNGIAPAVKGGQRRLVRNLLAMGESPTAKDDNGDAPIHLAASRGHGLIVRTLLIEGADVNELDQKGRTPLHLASSSGDDVGVRALLVAGACPRYRHESTQLSALDFAAWNGNVDVMKTLLGKGADVNARNGKGRGALHLAAEENQVGVIEFLARETSGDVDWKDDREVTPLHVAAIKGHLPAVNALVSAGADISLRTNKDYFLGYGPRRDDCSALDLASHGGHMDILKALVRHGADVKALSSEHDISPLHHATGGKKLDAMHFLLDEGADANAGIDGWWKPIHLAVEIASVEAIQVLAQHGADLTACNDDGSPPLAMAAEKQNFDLVNALFAAGANLNPPGDGCAVLKAAVSSDERSEDMLKLLLKRGADVNAVDFDGCNVLHEAMRYGTAAIVDLLVEASAAVDGHFGDDSGDHYPSPLHSACGFRECGVASCAVVKALLGHGASVNLPGNDGNTPLHYASENLSPEIVELLLRTGADESIVNDDGETPAEYCKRDNRVVHPQDEESFEHVLRLLKGAPADRAWRRRGLLVLCRAFPDKARLAPERIRAKLPRAAERRAPFGGGGGDVEGEGTGGELAVVKSGSALYRVLTGLVRLDEEGIFRNIVCFL